MQLKITKACFMRFLARTAFICEILLIALAVISSAMVVMPVCSKSKADSYAKACLSNLKQIGEAVAMYADDNNQTLVPLVLNEKVSESPRFNGRKFSRLLLIPYLKSTRVLLCPALASQAMAWSTLDQDAVGTYALSSYVCSMDSDFQGHYLTRKSQYSNPERLILGSEVKNGVWSTGMSLLWDKNPIYYAPYTHANKISLIFLDGHTRIMYLWDTVGSVPSEWLWSDPGVMGPGNDAEIQQQQTQIRTKWPKTYPKP